MHTDTSRENSQATAPQATDDQQSLSATAPGQLRVIKRNGTVVPYTEESKITVAITKAFLAVEGGTAAASSAAFMKPLRALTEQVAATFQAPHAVRRHHPHRGCTGPGRTGPDAFAGEQKVARDYVIYREAQARRRASARPHCLRKLSACRTTAFDVTQPRRQSCCRWTWAAWTR